MILMLQRIPVEIESHGEIFTSCSIGINNRAIKVTHRGAWIALKLVSVCQSPAVYVDKSEFRAIRMRSRIT